jgi:hypothetical protein
MGVMEKSLELSFQRLGFTPYDLGMETRIGKVELQAVEHPLKGIALFFTCVEPRTASQFETFVSRTCTAEQIAIIIYAHFLLNLKEHADECRRHFAACGISLGAN